MAEISEAISMIKKAESDAVQVVEDAKVKSEDLINEILVRPERTPFPFLSLKPLLTPYLSNNPKSIL